MLVTGALKRALVGRPYRSDALGETLLPKRIAVPVFASDALSSVAYAPDEILLTLAIAGVTAITVSPWVALAVAAVLLTVIASYRQNVHAYPSGGGDYEVVTENLGRRGGVAIGSALMVDYVLTVAVSISSASQYAASALPSLSGHETALAVGLVVVLTTMNLRGVRESGATFAIPTYVYIVAILGMVAVGAVRASTGSLPPAESADLTIVTQAGFDAGLVGIAGVLLLLRAFSSGATALTGIEAISNGVPAFRKPKSRNAASTLLILGALSSTMLVGVVVLATRMKVHFAEDPTTQLQRDGRFLTADYHQRPVIGQIARAVFDGFPPGFLVVTVATGLILVLAANTAFNGFPVLASILARDSLLPKQLNTRGDRLAFSNGIIALASAALVLIIAFDAQVTRLIQLYVVGVFISFTMSQLGMVRHWTRLLTAGGLEPSQRRRMQRSRVVNAVGLTMTGSALIIVLVSKLTHGAWIALVAMALLYLMMNGIHRHYERVASELAIDDGPVRTTLPSRVHAVVLIAGLHKASLRALAYAQVSRPTTIEAISVSTDPETTRDLQRRWDAAQIPVPLTVLDSPYREVTRPLVDHVRARRRESPRDLVVVYIPEYVVGHWWEQALHNQTALRLKTRLLFTPGVVVASVPWQLESSEGTEDRWDGRAPGMVRQGLPDPSGRTP